MNKSQSFNALIDLVQLDTSIQAQQENIDRLFVQEQQLEKQKQMLEKALSELKNAVLIAKEQVDAVELDMQVLDEQEKGKKKYIDGLTDYKEYKSLQAEIEHLHEDQRKQEQMVIDAWNVFEFAENKYVQQLPVIQEKIEKTVKDLEKCKQDQELIKEQINQQKQQRPTKEALVPKDWMEKYILMQSRVKNPVVSIELNSCAACFYHLTSTDLQSAKKGSLIQCKNCFRLLYLDQIT
ncbi:hypothetical protein EKK58_03215 [Candidatus Dependentiae bacterium]|nr:MAG: hypothetical protein EKK58_03215 [Candidatus Dependentiae bacterium]